MGRQKKGKAESTLLKGMGENNTSVVKGWKSDFAICFFIPKGPTFSFRTPKSLHRTLRNEGDPAAGVMMVFIHEEGAMSHGGCSHLKED